MAKHKSNTNVERKSMVYVEKAQHSAPVSIRIPTKFFPPLRYVGGDLALDNIGKSGIDLLDANGNFFETTSVEWVLKNIDLFRKGIDQTRLLLDAALHFGFDSHALMGADLDSMGDVWDVREGSGQVLLAGVTFNTACAAAPNFKRRPGLLLDDIVIKHARRAVKNDCRHDGPLTLLHHNLGVLTFTGVAVKSHAGRCAMMLEEVLWRLDQFSQADQDELMAGLAKHFDLDMGAVAARHGGRA